MLAISCMNIDNVDLTNVIFHLSSMKNSISLCSLIFKLAKILMLPMLFPYIPR